MVGAVVGTIVGTMVDAIHDEILNIVDELPPARNVKAQNTKSANIYVPTQRGGLQQ